MSLLLNKNGFGGKRKRVLRTTEAYSSQEHKDRLQEWSDTFLSLGLGVGFYFVGIVAYSYNVERMSVPDSVYFATVTMTTAGFGDIYPSNQKSRIFTIFYAVIGVCLVAACFGQLTEYAMRQREELMARAQREVLTQAPGNAQKQITERPEETLESGVFGAIKRGVSRLSFSSAPTPSSSSSSSSPMPPTSLDGSGSGGGRRFAGGGLSLDSSGSGELGSPRFVSGHSSSFSSGTTRLGPSFGVKGGSGGASVVGAAGARPKSRSMSSSGTRSGSGGGGGGGGGDPENPSTSAAENEDDGEPPPLVMPNPLAPPCGPCAFVGWLFARFPVLWVVLQLAAYAVATGFLYSVFEEDWTVIDGVYYAVISGTSVGYGDVAPTTTKSRWLTLAWLPLSIMFTGAQLGKVGNCIFGFTGEEKLAGLLAVDLSLQALLDMDTDGDGDITEFEYLKFMLVNCKLADESVLDALHARFEQMDTDGSGALTREDLVSIIEQEVEAPLEPCGVAGALESVPAQAVEGMLEEGSQQLKGFVESLKQPDLTALQHTYAHLSSTSSSISSSKAPLTAAAASGGGRGVVPKRSNSKSFGRTPNSESSGKPLRSSLNSGGSGSGSKGATVKVVTDQQEPNPSSSSSSSSSLLPLLSSSEATSAPPEEAQRGLKSPTKGPRSSHRSPPASPSSSSSSSSSYTALPSPPSSTQSSSVSSPPSSTSSRSRARLSSKESKASPRSSSSGGPRPPRATEPRSSSFSSALASREAQLQVPQQEETPRAGSSQRPSSGRLPLAPPSLPSTPSSSSSSTSSFHSSAQQQRNPSPAPSVGSVSSVVSIGVHSPVPAAAAAAAPSSFSFDRGSGGRVGGAGSGRGRARPSAAAATRTGGDA